MYQRQIIIEVQNGGYLNKDAKLDFKFKFNGKFGKFKRLSSEEITKLSSEHIIEYHSDLVDYIKFLKKISEPAEKKLLPTLQSMPRSRTAGVLPMITVRASEFRLTGITVTAGSCSDFRYTIRLCLSMLKVTARAV